MLVILDFCSFRVYDGVRCENIKRKNVCDSLKFVKVNYLNEDVPDRFKMVNNRDLKFCDNVTYKKAGFYHSVLAGKSRLIALFVKSIVQNMEDHSKDLQNASTQHMLTPRKSCL